MAEAPGQTLSVLVRLARLAEMASGGPERWVTIVVLLPRRFHVAAPAPSSFSCLLGRRRDDCCWRESFLQRRCWWGRRCWGGCIKNGRRCRASGCSGRDTFTPASHIRGRVGIQRWRAQVARYGNLVDASLVAKDYAHPKAGVDAMLIQSEKILPRNSWLGVGARAISYNTDPGGRRIGDSTAAR